LKIENEIQNTGTVVKALYANVIERNNDIAYITENELERLV